MWPILPFLAGAVIGASALGLARKAKVSPRVGSAVDQASRKLRKAALSGLEAVRQSSEQWRDRLAAEEPQAPPAAPAGRKPRAAKNEAPKSETPKKSA
ncbi:MAG: hypothetical protein LBI92_03090 [Azoarcus sp.]|jgi:hypothetical protein|nr:hypothetical protein [Azoarcus sp.]